MYPYSGMFIEPLTSALHTKKYAGIFSFDFNVVEYCIRQCCIPMTTKYKFSHQTFLRIPSRYVSAQNIFWLMFPSPQHANKPTIFILSIIPLYPQALKAPKSSVHSAPLHKTLFICHNRKMFGLASFQPDLMYAGLVTTCRNLPAKKQVGKLLAIYLCDMWHEEFARRANVLKRIIINIWRGRLKYNKARRAYSSVQIMHFPENMLRFW